MRLMLLSITQTHEATEMTTSNTKLIAELKETAMLAAHRAGRSYAHHQNSTRKDAFEIACGLLSEDERWAFVAGFEGELKRIGPIITA
jgi:hypothetical protein